MSCQTDGMGCKRGVRGVGNSHFNVTLSKGATLSDCAQIEADRKTGRRNQVVDVVKSTAGVTGVW